MIQFELEKQNALTKADKSDEQRWDDKIVELCNVINEKENYFTTSSCAGRITLNRNSMKKMPNAFILKTHNLGDFQEISQVIIESTDEIIYFRQEPCALHVACQSLNDAIELLKKAKEAGWKRSGIFSTNSDKFTCELVSTEWIVAPIKLDGELIADENYIKKLTKEANIKLKKTWDKIERLKTII